MHILVITLLAACAAGALAFTCMFVSALLFPTSVWGRQNRGLFKWMPPLGEPAAQRNWAAAAAEESARECIGSNPSAKTASALAAEIQAGATRAMLPLSSHAELSRLMACPATMEGMVGVTAPEALAIAEQIRKNCTQAEQARICDLAGENSRKLASQPRTRAAGDCACLLQAEDHICSLFQTRPLRCRPAHAAQMARASAPDASAAGPIAEGMEHGLRKALESAGLDANVYELNSALAAALQSRNAAERWAKGEMVFARCLRADE